MTLNSYDSLYSKPVDDGKTIDVMGEAHPRPTQDAIDAVKAEAEQYLQTDEGRARVAELAREMMGAPSEEVGPPLANPTAKTMTQAEWNRIRLTAAQIATRLDVAPPPMAFPERIRGVMGCAEVLMGDGPNMPRPSRDEFFFQMAELASTMATCPRAHCGAVIVRHKRPLSLGYNGPAEGAEHCPSEGQALIGHLSVQHCLESTHAEVNAIKNAVGNVYGATIYVYGHVGCCTNCVQELNRVGITDIRHRPGPHHGVQR